MPTEQVYVGKTAKRSNVYHTTECQHWDRELAEAWGLEECAVCSDEPQNCDGPQLCDQLERIGKENYPEKSEP